ncbi:DUF547 domain-containing protein [bacterium]|nr:DUF547 domain-containing protein [bacterium]
MPHLFKNLFIHLLLTMSISASQSYPVEKGFDHSQFDSLLAQFVTDGLVRYKDLRERGKRTLESYLTRLAMANNITSMPGNDQLALYINAYNAYNLKAVVDHYPINGWNPLYPKNSIRQIKGVWKKWEIQVGQKTMTLDDLEHKIIRKFKDPRVHFGVNCASIGCPTLANYAYTGPKLNEQLDERGVEFLTQPSRFQFSADSQAIWLNKILEWFPKDFNSFATDQTKKYRNYAGVIGFLMNYLPSDLARRLQSESVPIKFLKYDWSLNEAKSRATK